MYICEGRVVCVSYPAPAAMYSVAKIQIITWAEHEDWRSEKSLRFYKRANVIDLHSALQCWESGMQILFTPIPMRACPALKGPIPGNEFLKS